MNDTVAVTLPGGYWLDGACHREVRLRRLTGGDEAFLVEAGESLLPAQRTTRLLARCLERLGPLRPVTADSVRALTIGDREALLLHLRGLTLGESMACLLSCPNQVCRERMDLDLNVNDLLVSPYLLAQAVHERTIRENGTAYRVRFRLPTGADQEAAAALARRDLQAAADLVLQRCVMAVAGEDEQPVNALPAPVARALPKVMADLDPQAEVLLNLTCPACGLAFVALFDTADYFHRELAGQRDLYREIHLLAFHYHWSEADIMAMTRQKRRLYLGLLAEALGGGKGP